MSQKTFSTLLSIAFLIVALPVVAHETAAPGHVFFKPGDIVWQEGPAALPPGSKMAVLHGDPAKSGLFTIRAVLPDGYRVPPHWHPTDEHVTVLSGTFHLGMGDRFDPASGTEMPAGTYGFMGAKMHHYAWASGETVIQVHAMGPFEVHYLNPDDDPRKKKEKSGKPAGS